MMCCVLVLVSCGTKRKMAVGQETAAESAPMWHTCLIQNARATLSLGDNQIAANVTMQTVRDSMLVISVMPLLGLEIARFEATPFELTGFNKLEGTYATTTYAELNRNLVPTINWDVLQQLCTAELPTGDKNARLVYTLGDKTVELSVIYPVRKLDVPVKVNKQDPPLIHRDIKPSNIMMKSGGDIVLIDYNASKEFHEGNNQDTSLFGTQYFAAPEQLIGYIQSDERTDIYGLGATMSYLMTKMPVQQMVAPGKLAEVWQKCTQMAQKDRYNNVDELAADILKYWNA